MRRRPEAVLLAGGQLDPYQSSMGGDYYYPCDSPGDPLGSAASLWINADGKRYCNEGFGFMEWAAYAGALQPAGKIANVFDSNYEALIKAQPACHMGIDYPNGGMDGLPPILEAAVAGGRKAPAPIPTPSCTPPTTTRPGRIFGLRGRGPGQLRGVHRALQRAVRHRPRRGLR